VANAKGANSKRQRSQSGREQGRPANPIWWPPKPRVGYVVHGVPARVAKLRAAGNAIVPQVAAEFIKATMP
jgi:hypothetical protein